MYHTHLLPDPFCSESVLPKHDCYKRDDKTKVCKVRFRSVTAHHGLSMRYFPIPVRTFVDILLILQMYCISLCLPLNMHAVRWSYVVSVIELAYRIHDMNVDLAASTSLSSRYTLTYYGHDFFLFCKWIRNSYMLMLIDYVPSDIMSKKCTFKWATKCC